MEGWQEAKWQWASGQYGDDYLERASPRSPIGAENPLMTSALAARAHG
jgi:hypothetical protein